MRNRKRILTVSLVTPMFLIMLGARECPTNGQYNLNMNMEDACYKQYADCSESAENSVERQTCLTQANACREDLIQFASASNAKYDDVGEGCFAPYNLCVLDALTEEQRVKCLDDVKECWNAYLQFKDKLKKLETLTTESTDTTSNAATTDSTTTTLSSDSAVDSGANDPSSTDTDTTDPAAGTAAF